MKDNRKRIAMIAVAFALAGFLLLPHDTFAEGNDADALDAGAMTSLSELEQSSADTMSAEEDAMTWGQAESETAAARKDSADTTERALAKLSNTIIVFGVLSLLLQAACAAGIVVIGIMVRSSALNRQDFGNEQKKEDVFLEIISDYFSDQFNAIFNAIHGAPEQSASCIQPAAPSEEDGTNGPAQEDFVYPEEFKHDPSFEILKSHIRLWAESVPNDDMEQLRSALDRFSKRSPTDKEAVGTALRDLAQAISGIMFSLDKTAGEVVGELKQWKDYLLASSGGDIDFRLQVPNVGDPYDYNWMKSIGWQTCMQVKNVYTWYVLINDGNNGPVKRLAEVD